MPRTAPLHEHGSAAAAAATEVTAALSTPAVAASSSASYYNRSSSPAAALFADHLALRGQPFSIQTEAPAALRLHGFGEDAQRDADGQRDRDHLLLLHRAVRTALASSGSALAAHQIDKTLNVFFDRAYFLSLLSYAPFVAEANSYWCACRQLMARRAEERSAAAKGQALLAWQKLHWWIIFLQLGAIMKQPMAFFAPVGSKPETKKDATVDDAAAPAAAAAPAPAPACTMAELDRSCPVRQFYEEYFEPSLITRAGVDSQLSSTVQSINGRIEQAVPPRAITQQMHDTAMQHISQLLNTLDPYLPPAPPVHFHPTTVEIIVPGEPSAAAAAAGEEHKQAPSADRVVTFRNWTRQRSDGSYEIDDNRFREPIAESRAHALAAAAAVPSVLPSAPSAAAASSAATSPPRHTLPVASSATPGNVIIPMEPDSDDEEETADTAMAAATTPIQEEHKELAAPQIRPAAAAINVSPSSLSTMHPAQETANWSAASAAHMLTAAAHVPSAIAAVVPPLTFSAPSQQQLPAFASSPLLAVIPPVAANLRAILPASPSISRPTPAALAGPNGGFMCREPGCPKQHVEFGTVIQYDHHWRRTHTMDFVCTDATCVVCIKKKGGKRATFGSAADLQKHRTCAEKQRAAGTSPSPAAAGGGGAVVPVPTLPHNQGSPQSSQLGAVATAAPGLVVAARPSGAGSPLPSLLTSPRQLPRVPSQLRADDSMVDEEDMNAEGAPSLASASPAAAAASSPSTPKAPPPTLPSPSIASDLPVPLMAPQLSQVDEGDEDADDDAAPATKPEPINVHIASSQVDPCAQTNLPTVEVNVAHRPSTTLPVAAPAAVAGSSSDMDLGDEPAEDVQRPTLFFAPSSASSSSSAAAATPTVVHSGVSCDGCLEEPIRGTRYRCSVCPVNLCELCELAGTKHAQEHKMIKMCKAGDGAPTTQPAVSAADFSLAGSVVGASSASAVSAPSSIQESQVRSILRECFNHTRPESPSMKQARLFEVQASVTQLNGTKPPLSVLQTTLMYLNNKPLSTGPSAAAAAAALSQPPLLNVPSNHNQAQGGNGVEGAQSVEPNKRKTAAGSDALDEGEAEQTAPLSLAAPAAFVPAPPAVAPLASPVAAAPTPAGLVSEDTASKPVSVSTLFGTSAMPHTPPTAVAPRTPPTGPAAQPSTIAAAAPTPVLTLRAATPTALPTTTTRIPFGGPPSPGAASGAAARVTPPSPKEVRRQMARKSKADALPALRPSSATPLSTPSLPAAAAKPVVPAPSAPTAAATATTPPALAPKQPSGAIPAAPIVDSDLQKLADAHLKAIQPKELQCAPLANDASLSALNRQAAQNLPSTQSSDPAVNEATPIVVVAPVASAPAPAVAAAAPASPARPALASPPPSLSVATLSPFQTRKQRDEGHEAQKENVASALGPVGSPLKPASVGAVLPSQAMETDEEAASKQRVSSSSAAAPTASAVHIGVTCDGCRSNPLLGNRYACVDCRRAPGFDLCEQCNRACAKPHQHPLLKLRTSPVDASNAALKKQHADELAQDVHDWFAACIAKPNPVHSEFSLTVEFFLPSPIPPADIVPTYPGDPHVQLERMYVNINDEPESAGFGRRAHKDKATGRNAESEDDGADVGDMDDPTLAIAPSQPETRKRARMAGASAHAEAAANEEAIGEADAPAMIDADPPAASTDVAAAAAASPKTPAKNHPSKPSSEVATSQRAKAAAKPAPPAPVSPAFAPATPLSASKVVAETSPSAAAASFAAHDAIDLTADDSPEVPSPRLRAAKHKKKTPPRNRSKIPAVKRAAKRVASAAAAAGAGEPEEHKAASDDKDDELKAVLAASLMFSSAAASAARPTAAVSESAAAALAAASAALSSPASQPAAAAASRPNKRAATKRKTAAEDEADAHEDDTAEEHDQQSAVPQTPARKTTNRAGRPSPASAARSPAAAAAAAPAAASSTPLLQSSVAAVSSTPKSNPKKKARVSTADVVETSSEDLFAELRGDVTPTHGGADHSALLQPSQQPRDNEPTSPSDDSIEY